MGIIHTWAAAWGVSSAAIADLQRRLGVSGDAAPLVSLTTDATGSESRQQGLVRLEAARLGVWLTRNNVGALLDERGVPVRYGLANETKQQNEVFKSSDLIGIRPVVVQQCHVGTVIGQFVAREMKYEGWKYNPRDKREKAQLAFIEFVLSKGGDAAFATGPGTL